MLRYLAVDCFRQNDILRSMPVSVRVLEQAHAQVRAAIVHRRPIAAFYRGRRRLLCPHLLGWNKHRRLQVLCYQYGGDSESGLKPASASDAHSDEADHAFQSDADHLRSEATQSSLSVEH